jgi:MoaA/NifB/PqqE/SkfB family radical SAM enzyme
MNKETFCTKPFSGIFLSPDGNIKYCCALNENLGNVNEKPIDEIMNGELAVDIRKKIINGEWHSACTYCKTVESKGGKSERIGEMDQFVNEEFKLREIDLRWSNTCNLSCNYCNPLFSSKWAQIFNQKINQNKEHSESSLIDYVINNDDTLTNVLLLGGEPLLQKQNQELLSRIGDANIQLLTNLSVDLTNNKIFNILKTNNNVVWNVSFETIKDRFEYVRHGAEWEVFLNNLRTVAKVSKIGIGAQPVYCVYSAFNLVEYYDFIESEGYFNNVHWQNLTHPNVLDVFNLPKELKDLAIEEIDRCVLKHKKFDFTTLINIKHSLMESEETDYSKKLLDFNNNLENNQLKDKKYKFEDLYPKVFKILLEKNDK